MNARSAITVVFKVLGSTGPVLHPPKLATELTSVRRGIQPQGVQIPLKTPLLLPCRHTSAWPPPPPPPHAGWPSPARPSRMKFQPRPGFEALEVRGGRIFRSKHCMFFWALVAPCRPKAPGGPWSPLEPPGGPCRPLEPPETAWNCVETLTMMGLAFWVH